MAVCTPEHANPAFFNNDPKFNPPAIVQVLRLDEQSFSIGSRGKFGSLLELANELKNYENPPTKAQANAPLKLAQEKIKSASTPEPLPADQEMSAYDGMFVGADGKVYSNTEALSKIPPVVPEAAPARMQARIIYVNGMSTPLGQCHEGMQAVANTFKMPVVGIYNATDGNFFDVLQTITDKFNLAENPAVNTLEREMLRVVRAGEELHLVGDSHGALIISRTLDRVIAALKEQGWSAETIEKSLGNLKIETFGGAAWSYPDGPKYVHYINEFDPVPFHFGLTPYGLQSEDLARLEKRLIEPNWMKPLSGLTDLLEVDYFAERSPGKNGKIIRFQQGAGGTWVEAHMIWAYLPHRQPFDTAYDQSNPAKSWFEWAPVMDMAAKWLLIGIGISLLPKGYRLLKQALRKDKGATPSDPK